MPNPIQTFVKNFRNLFTVQRENDSTLLLGAASAQAPQDRDRFQYDREDVLHDSIEAWRLNPLARRIVGLVSQYVVGGGVELTCKNVSANKFLTDFWNHRLNHMQARVYEWCDELTRSGNLFILLTTDQTGMSFVRAIPAAQIDKIIARGNDIEQPIYFIPKPTLEDPDPTAWPAYDPITDSQDETGRFWPVMLHYAINRPVGAQWGESDLTPILKWLSRYANWLEDRARLNRFRNAFMFVVKGRFASEADRIARQRSLNNNPPSPGSILVADESEEWTVLDPKLDSNNANDDGLALKKMIASGSGIPLHFLAEPESATRTTAEAAGGPTYRHFEQRQEFFTWMLSDILQAVINRRAMVDRRVPRKLVFQVLGADISSRDNMALASSGANLEPILADLRDRRLIDDTEYLRLFYRFIGETIDLEDMLLRGKEAPDPDIFLDPRHTRPAVDRPAGTKPAEDPRKGATDPQGNDKTNAPLKPKSVASLLDPETGEPK